MIDKKYRQNYKTKKHKIFRLHMRRVTVSRAYRSLSSDHPKKENSVTNNERRTFSPRKVQMPVMEMDGDGDGDGDNYLHQFRRSAHAM